MTNTQNTDFETIGNFDPERSRMRDAFGTDIIEKSFSFVDDAPKGAGAKKARTWWVEFQQYHPGGNMFLQTIYRARFGRNGTHLDDIVFCDDVSIGMPGTDPATFPEDFWELHAQSVFESARQNFKTSPRSGDVGYGPNISACTDCGSAIPQRGFVGACPECAKLTDLAKKLLKAANPIAPTFTAVLLLNAGIKVKPTSTLLNLEKAGYITFEKEGVALTPRGARWRNKAQQASA